MEVHRPQLYPIHTGKTPCRHSYSRLAIDAFTLGSTTAPPLPRFAAAGSGSGAGAGCGWGSGVGLDCFAFFPLP